MAAPPRLPINLVLPINIDFKKWSHSLYLDLQLKTVPVNFEEDRWWDWAQEFVSINYFDGIAPLATKTSYPNKEDWRKWAKQFFSSLNALT